MTFESQWRLPRQSFHGDESGARKSNTKPTHRTQYSKETDIGIGAFLANAPHEIDERPACVFRWSFDDFRVEDVWSERKEEGGGAFVDVVSEHIADVQLMQAFKEHLFHPNYGSWAASMPAAAALRTEPRLSTSTDFVACSKRRIWLHRALLDHPGLQEDRLLRGAVGSGRFWISKVQSFGGRTPQQEAESLLHPFRPPDFRRYTLLFRGCDPHKTSISGIVSRLQRMTATGVPNYSPVARYGFHLSRCFQSGLHLMQREYSTFLMRYLTELTEGSDLLEKELDALGVVLTDVTSAPRDVKQSLRAFERAVDFTAKRHLSGVLSDPGSGVYGEHISMLQAFAERSAALSNAALKDSARLVRESVSRQTLVGTLRAVSDVHFNAWATLRLQLMGQKVRVGDVVCVDDAYFGDMDAVTLSKDDHHFSIGEEHLFAGDATSDETGQRFRVIATELEAEQYQLHQVVLPRWGRVAATTTLAPQHACGGVMRDELAIRLGVGALPEMKLGPVSTYRPLVVRPRNMSYFMVDEIRGVRFGSEELEKELQVDADGIRRCPAVHLMAHSMTTRRPHVARPGITGGNARSRFLSLATRPGYLCVLRFDLPLHASPHAVVRELFKTKSVDPTAILELMQHHRR